MVVQFNTEAEGQNGCLRVRANKGGCVIKKNQHVTMFHLLILSDVNKKQHSVDVHKQD